MLIQIPVLMNFFFFFFLNGAIIFTIMVIYSGYHQKKKLEEDSIEITTFKLIDSKITNLKLCHFWIKLVLKTSFQCEMNRILFPLIW